MTERTLASGPVGPFQLQAAIAAVHAEAPTAADTDWREITALYKILEAIAPESRCSRSTASVALAMCEGPRAGLELLADVAADDRGGRQPPGPRRPRAPARIGRGRRGGIRAVRTGGPAHDQPAGARLPVAPSAIDVEPTRMNRCSEMDALSRGMS